MAKNNKRKQGEKQVKEITLYTLPHCTQCTATKRWLNNRNIEYTEIKLKEDEEAYKYVTETLKYKAAPVITVMEEPSPKNPNVSISFVSWSGFNIEALEDHALNSEPI